MRFCVLGLALLAAPGVAAADQPPVPKSPPPEAPKKISLASLLARTDAVTKEVSKLRGLPIKKPIPNEVIDKDELKARLLKIANEDKTKRETAAEGFALGRWGMIPLKTDYQAMLIEVLSDQIAGYYDPDTKKLTISKSAGDDGEWAELVLAHEIQHGLQDQSFDLKKFQDLPESEGDAAAARRALIEGDGIALMIEVMLKRQGMASPWSNPAVAEAIEKSMSVPGAGDSLDRAPVAIRESMIFSYRSGLTFVAALRRRQPWSAVDAAFARPPRSTEQILHPERYLADDRPVPIAIDVPPVLRGYGVRHATVWGELGVSLYLRSHGIDPATAVAAAEGWGGDRAVVLAREGEQRPEHGIGIARTEWDSEADAIEAHESTVKAIDAAVMGAVIEHSANRTKWLGLDGHVSWVERKGPSMIVVHGAPLWAAGKLATQLWTAARVVPAPPDKPVKRTRKR